MTSVVHLLNDIGPALVRWMAWMNVWTIALFAVAICVDWLLAPRVHARWRILLYMLVLARLALPVSWNSPLSVLNSTGERVAQRAGPADSPGFIWWLESIDGWEHGADGASAGTPSVTDSATSVRPVSIFPTAAAATYFCISGLFLALWSGARWRLARQMRGARPSRPMLRTAIPSRHVVEHPSIGPAVVGMLRPTIVLPVTLVNESENNMRAQKSLHWIIRHEEAHIASGDHLLAPILQLLTILCWPIAPVWLAARRIRHLMEQACDERALGAAHTDDHRSYGETLLEMADWSSRRWPSAAISHVGLLGHVTTGLRGRMRALRRLGVPRWPAMTQVLTIMLVASTLLTVSTVRASSAAPPVLAEGEDLVLAQQKPQVMVSVRVFGSWMKHAKLEYKVAQTALMPGETEPATKPVGPEAHRMSSEEFKSYLEAMQREGRGRVLYEPRLLVESGQSAWLSIASDPDQQPQIDGIRFDVTPTVNEDGTITVTASFKEMGLDVKPPASEYDGGDQIRASLRSVTMRSGETQFMLATGLIGAPLRLVSVTVERVGAGPPDELPAWLNDLEFPQMEYYAVVWDCAVKPDELKDAIPIEKQAQKVVWMGDRSTSMPAESIYVLTGDETKVVFDWLRENALGTSMGGKSGAAMEVPGRPIAIRCDTSTSDGRAITPFRITSHAIIDDDKRIESSFRYELMRGNEREGASAPISKSVDSTIVVDEDMSVVVVLPPLEDDAGQQSPWRVLVLRTSVLRSAEDFPFQRAIGSIEEAGVDIDPPILNLRDR